MIPTEVPDELASNGVGHKIVKEALDWIEHRKMVPLCPFVKSFVVDNLEDCKDIIAEDTKL